jgi:D-psicose/D-tagatose/L-ribulose 3-epimerase
MAAMSSRDAGFDLIEIPVLDPSSIDVTATTAALRDAGIGARCSLGLSWSTDISSADDSVVARGEALLSDALSVARDVGSPYLGGVIYSALGKYQEMPTERGRSNAVGALRRLAEKARASGISLGLEVVNRYESNLLNTAEQALALIDDIGMANVVVHLDTYHMNIEESDFRTPVIRCGSRLGYVHIGESYRGYLGTGTVDFPQLFGALAEIGYEGTITFESFSSSVVAPDLSRTLAIWRNTWSDSADLARQARAFIAAAMARQPVATG